MPLTRQVSVLDWTWAAVGDVAADAIVVVVVVAAVVAAVVEVVVVVHWMRSCCFEAAAGREFRKCLGDGTGWTLTEAEEGTERLRTDPPIRTGSGIRTGDGWIGGIADFRRIGPDSGWEDLEG